MESTPGDESDLKGSEPDLSFESQANTQSDTPEKSISDKKLKFKQVKLQFDRNPRKTTVSTDEVDLTSEVIDLKQWTIDLLPYFEVSGKTKGDHGQWKISMICKICMASNKKTNVITDKGKYGFKRHLQVLWTEIIFLIV